MARVISIVNQKGGVGFGFMIARVGSLMKPRARQYGSWKRSGAYCRLSKRIWLFNQF